jgi:hypothetical protein
MSSLHALTAVKRAKQRTLTAIGLGHETKDPQFEQHEARYKERAELTARLSELVRKTVSSSIDLTASAAAVSQVLSKLTGVADTRQAALLSKHNDALVQCADSGDVMKSTLQANVILPLCKYEGQFHLLEARMKLRETRKIDMDRYVSALASKSRRDRATFERAQAKAEGSKAAFHLLNEELKKDLPNVSNKLQAMMDYAVQSLLRDQGRHALNCTNALAQVQGALRDAGVRPGGARGVPSPVTPLTQSVMQDADVKRRTLDEMGPAPTGLLALPAGSGSSRGSATSRASPRASITAGRPQPMPPAKKKAIAAPPAVTAVAQWDFAGTESDEVPVRKGEVVTVIDESDPDWWLVRNQAGKQGTAPSNYLKKQ